jgi:hypothetical protein
LSQPSKAVHKLCGAAADILRNNRPALTCSVAIKYYYNEDDSLTATPLRYL